MPVLEGEAATCGHILEDRHMVAAFREGEEALENFHEGVAVVAMLMVLNRSAEIGSTVHLPAEDLKTHVPAVTRGEYQG
jgi:hypothetical protein